MFKKWISQLKEFIQHVRGVKLKRGNECLSVAFSYKVTEDISLEVDLLVSPFWEHPDNFYQFLRTVPERDRIL